MAPRRNALPALWSARFEDCCRGIPEQGPNVSRHRRRAPHFFATFLMEKISIEEFNKNFEEMERYQFADYYTSKIPREWQEGAGEHINWWNFQKAEKMLIKAGFETVYRSTAQKSRFAEMRGIGYKTGFDSTHPEISVTVIIKKFNFFGKSIGRKMKKSEFFAYYANQIFIIF